MGTAVAESETDVIAVALNHCSGKRVAALAGAGFRRDTVVVFAGAGVIGALVDLAVIDGLAAIGFFQKDATLPFKTQVHGAEFFVSAWNVVRSRGGTKSGCRAGAEDDRARFHRSVAGTELGEGAGATYSATAVRTTLFAFAIRGTGVLCNFDGGYDIRGVPWRCIQPDEATCIVRLDWRDGSLLCVGAAIVLRNCCLVRCDTARCESENKKEPVYRSHVSLLCPRYEDCFCLNAEVGDCQIISYIPYKQNAARVHRAAGATAPVFVAWLVLAQRRDLVVHLEHASFDDLSNEPTAILKHLGESWFAA